MRDHDPRNAPLDADNAGGVDGRAYDSVRDLEVDDGRYSRPSLRYIDIHERPTLVP
jgi:hypothetical protein